MPTDDEAFDAVLVQVRQTRATVQEMHSKALSTIASRSGEPPASATGGQQRDIAGPGKALGGGSDAAASAAAVSADVAALAPSAKIVASLPNRLSKNTRSRFCWFLGGFAILSLVVAAVLAASNSSEANNLLLVGGAISVLALLLMYLMAMGFGKVDLEFAMGGAEPSDADAAPTQEGAKSGASASDGPKLGVKPDVAKS